MRRFLVERNIPGAGKLSPPELRAFAQKSCEVLQAMGSQIQWIHSYVTDDKIYCVYLAPSAEMIRDHAKRGGIPADRIFGVRSMIDPTTSE